ncbi:MAG: hypothetical protein IIB00_09135, partial [candidate division Zixibacteria bacterium]|nr:hypothetical protein [candidate division Zixibacteria bacterium]
MKKLRTIVIIAICAARVFGNIASASSPGVKMGTTFHDLQKYGSMNRQIAITDSLHIIYFSFTNKDNDHVNGHRNVRGQAYDPSFGAVTLFSPIDIGGPLDSKHRSGFTTLDVIGADSAVAVMGWDKNYVPPGKEIPYAYVNGIPGLMDFVEISPQGSVPESLWIDSLSTGGAVYSWPRVAVTDDGGCGQVIHLVIHDDGQTGYFMYVRRILGDTNWTHGYRFGQGGFRTPAITASRQSQKVGIAWSGGRGDGAEFGASVDRYDGDTSGQWDNDLYYMESQDCGANWGPIHNITQYPDDSSGGFRAHARVTVIYDTRDSLHMAWAAARWNGYGGPFGYSGKILHYDTESKAIRTAVNGQWNPR